MANPSWGIMMKIPIDGNHRWQCDTIHYLASCVVLPLVGHVARWRAVAVQLLP